jgi:hypothetical protein
MQNLFKHGEKAYFIVKKRAFDLFSKKFGDEPDMDIVQAYMKNIGADHVLKDHDSFIFCRTIEDATFEEIKITGEE